MAETPIFFKVYTTFVDSGLMAEMHPNHVKLLLALAKYMDEKGICYPSQETLAADCGFNDARIVRKWLTDKKSGLINTKFYSIGFNKIVELVERRKNAAGVEYNIYRVNSMSCFAKFDQQEPREG